MSCVRGFRLVGRVTARGVISLNEKLPIDSLLFFSYEPSGVYMRVGWRQVRHVRGLDFSTECEGDYVFAATAIGELAFKVGRHAEEIPLPPERAK